MQQQPPSPAPSSKLLRLAVAGAALLVVAGGVAFYLASAKLAGQSTGNAILVTIKDGACTPNDITVPAGRSTFKIVNESDRALEWEILDGVMVVEERENIVPGFSQTMEAKLRAGDYEITCGLLSSPRGSLHVTPSAESDAEAARPPVSAFIGPLAELQVFLVTQVNTLAKASKALDEAVKAGDLDGARAAYQAARVPYKEIEPMADMFADLHNMIDPVADYLEKREADPAFTGFHRLEYGLFAQNSTDGLAPVADRLVADIATLKDRLRGLRIPPEQIAKGSARLMRMLGENRIASGHDHYSQTDLADFSANLDGVTRMMALLRPVAIEANAAAVADIEKTTAEMAGALAALRSSDGFPAYAAVAADDRQALAGKARAVGDSIGKLNAALGLE